MTMDAILFLDNRNGLPSSPVSGQILLESLLLRLTKAFEPDSILDSDPMKPWHLIRSRINGERRSFRRYFLAFLPRVSGATELEVSPGRLPGRAWLTLWDRLVGSSPKGCIPRAWVRVHEAAVSAQDSDEHNALGATQLLIPSKGTWKKVLAETLHRAGALVESRRPGVVGLHLPKGVIPENPGMFARDLGELLRNHGGIPRSNAVLAVALGQIMAWQASPGGSPPRVRSEQFLQLAQDLGFDSFKSQALSSMVHARVGNFEMARAILEQSLSHCTSRHQIAMTLGNIGGMLLATGDWDEASRYLKDGLAYSASSVIVRHNHRLLIECLRDPFDGRETNHA